MNAARRDLHLLYASAFLRALGAGMAGVLAGVWLAGLGYSAAAAGAVIGTGLLGMALAAAVATFAGDRCGRRNFLLATAGLSALGGALLARGGGLPFLLLAAFLGMLNGMGRDRGAALVIEQAALPQMVAAEARTRAFAWYNVAQDLGHAFGGLLAALPAVLRSGLGWSAPAALRGGLGGYALLSLAVIPLYLRLSPDIEAAGAGPRAVSPPTRRVLGRLCGLFALDSLGGGFLTSALLVYFFHLRFGVGEEVMGPLFFAARILNALSHLAAAWLARRIGLVNTMVFTHIPSSLLLLTLAWAPTFPIAACLFLLREGLVEMDVPTRQSYLFAIVRAEERTAASGLTNLVRVAAWAVAPYLAGPLMDEGALWLPLGIGAGIKIAYDLLLWKAFRSLKPPEERAAASS